MGGVQRIYVCSTCLTPIEPIFPQGYDDTYGFRCPGTNPDCSPHESRELLTEEQVRYVESLPLDAGPNTVWYAVQAPSEDQVIEGDAEENS